MGELAKSSGEIFGLLAVSMARVYRGKAYLSCRIAARLMQFETGAGTGEMRENEIKLTKERCFGHLGLMNKQVLYILGLLPVPVSAATFEEPYHLKGGESGIQVESPGFACPALYDLDGDGKKDLLVGQFAGGKITVYPGLGAGKFGEGAALKAGGEVAEVPGVG